eukprot:2311031-Rhodomonas_salina.2
MPAYFGTLDLPTYWTYLPTDLPCIPTDTHTICGADILRWYCGRIGKTNASSSPSGQLCYAMSGTDVGYAAIVQAICLHVCYAMSGTNMDYAATVKSVCLLT